MPKESKVVKEFLDILEKNVKSDRTYYYHQYNAEPIVEFLIGLSSRRLGLLVSDKFWNYYPSWTHDRKVTRRSHFGGISSALAYINNYYPKLDRIIRNKSVGIIACNYLDVHRGKDRICAANRLFNAKDIRVRKRVANILPVKKVLKMLDDKDWGIRNTVIKRVGIDNCADRIYHWKDWHTAEALQALQLSDEQTVSLIEELETGNFESGYVWRKQQILLTLIKKLPTEKLLYMLDYIYDCDSDQLSEYVSKRILINS